MKVRRRPGRRTESDRSLPVAHIVPAATGGRRTSRGGGGPPLFYKTASRERSASRSPSRVPRTRAEVSRSRGEVMLLPKRSRRFGFRSRPHAVVGWLAVGLFSAGGSLANAPVEGATGRSADTSGRWTDGLSARGIRREPFVAVEALPPTSSPPQAPHAPLSRLDEEIGTPGALDGGVLLR